MGNKNRNTFNRALRHLKSTQIDEKISVLSEMPTNNTSKLYVLEPDRIEIDPNGTSPPDFNADNSELNGRDTTGLFESDGRIKVIEPPGDTNYILGPMAEMWYAWGNFTQIGYIRQSDRRMVNLARITGPMSSWNGTSGFLSYGQLTLEQAQWFKDTYRINYRAFYPGPPSNVPDQYGRYLCTMTGTPKGPVTTRIPGAKSGPELAGFPWGILGKTLKSLTGIEPGSILQFGARLLRSITDPIKYAGDYMFKGLPSGIEYLPNFTGAGPFGLPKIADMPGAVARWVTGGSSNPVSRVIDNTVQAVLGKNYATQYFTPDVTTAIKYAGPGGTVVAMPRTSGVAGIKNWFGSNVSRGFDFTKGIEQLVSTSETVASSRAGTTQVFKADDVAKLNQLAQQGAKTAGYMDTLIKAVPFVGAGAAIADTSLRLSKGDYVGAVLGGISAIPGPIGWVGLSAQITADISGITDPKSVNNKQASWVMNSIIDGLPSDLSGVYLGMSYKMKGTLISEETSIGVRQKYLNNIQKALFDLGVPRDKNELARQQAIYLMLNGVNPGLISLIVKAIVGDEYTEDEKKYLNDNFKKLIALFSFIREEKETKEKKETKNIKESKEETKVKKILREVKKPVVMKEIQQEKIKRRPKVIGAPPKTINSDLMKQAEVPTSFKPAEERVWGKYERRQNERMSQNKKNVVLDHLGASDHAWEYLLERNRSKDKYSGFFDKDGTPYTITRKEELNGENLLFIADENGKKESILQSELNDRLDYEFNKEVFNQYFAEQETLQADKDPLFKKVSKALKKEIDYTNKPSKLGYPNENPPEMVGGFHPDLIDGEKVSNAYNKLDPISANSMPPTGNPKIDAKVQKAKKLKSVKSVLPDS